MQIVRTVVLAWAVMALTACAHVNDSVSGGSESPQSDKASVSQTSTYLIGPDDQLQVNVWRNEDLSVSVPVRPDGMISVPLIGDVEAGGKTPRQVAIGIEQKLRRYIREPNVTVIVTELRSHEYLSRVRVTGAVTQPLSIPYRQGMTVLDAILEAGGVNDFAAPDRTRLYRREGEQTEIIPVRLSKVLSKGELGGNAYLRPGDIIAVPERMF